MKQHKTAPETRCKQSRLRNEALLCVSAHHERPLKKGQPHPGTSARTCRLSCLPTGTPDSEATKLTHPVVVVVRLLVLVKGSAVHCRDVRTQAETRLSSKQQRNEAPPEIELSKNTELLADLQGIGQKLGGASGTREARDVTWTAFAEAMKDKKFEIRSAEQIGGRHLVAFVAARKEAGVSNRTICNEMSHLRKALIAIGKAGLAKRPEYSNKALGIAGGSRIGTKQAMTDPTFQATVARLEALGRKGLAATFTLQRVLGLRAAEAIRAGNRQTLARMGREISARGFVRVVEGTKGGRPRDVHPVDRERALAAIRSALAVLRETKQTHLVIAADASGINLKQAMTIYKNALAREGVQSHSARYAFARQRVDAYKAEGLSLREALAATSLDLGHGDGRARYVASVYAREDA